MQCSLTVLSQNENMFPKKTPVFNPPILYDTGSALSNESSNLFRILSFKFSAVIFCFPAPRLVCLFQFLAFLRFAPFVLN